MKMSYTIAHSHMLWNKMPLNKATLYLEVLLQPEHSPHVQHVGGFCI